MKEITVLDIKKYKNVLKYKKKITQKQMKTKFATQVNGTYFLYKDLQLVSHHECKIFFLVAGKEVCEYFDSAQEAKVKFEQIKKELSFFWYGNQEDCFTLDKKELRTSPNTPNIAKAVKNS